MYLQKSFAKLKGKQFQPWYRYFDLTPLKLTSSWDFRARVALPIALFTAPPSPTQITRSQLRSDLSIVPDFRWDEKVHGTAETFLILVEDGDGAGIPFHDTCALRQPFAEDEYDVSLKDHMFKPVPPPRKLLHLHHFRSLANFPQAYTSPRSSTASTFGFALQKSSRRYTQTLRLSILWMTLLVLLPEMEWEDDPAPATFLPNTSSSIFRYDQLKPSN
ncbi:hypothetical protein BJ912DRAFT_1057181 [Pholiota molesta]|nr:hypothetical protein BJ912DRAFT_1057181 [Pholiota molesta]